MFKIELISIPFVLIFISQQKEEGVRPKLHIRCPQVWPWAGEAKGTGLPSVLLLHT